MSLRFEFATVARILFGSGLISQAGQAAECPKCHHPARRKMSTFAAFSASLGGVPKTVPGAGGGSCSGCSSGDCGTCAS